MTYDARQAAFREQKAWIEACVAALCYAYRQGADSDVHMHMGGKVEELCNHDWCHGIVDVLNRAYGSSHVSYRMPENNDVAKVN